MSLSDYDRGKRDGLEEALRLLRAEDRADLRPVVLALVQLMPRDPAGTSTVDMLGGSPPAQS